MTCEKGHFCRIHPPGGCRHGDYDYTFCDLLLKEPFYVEEVHFVCPWYLRNNEKSGGVTEVAQLVTYEWGTINSGSERVAPGAENVRSIIQRTGDHVLCEIEPIGVTHFGNGVCVVVPVVESKSD
jgi:hypothetical protein